ncbi:MAG: hypothetical protein LBI61_01965 [Puniceicoccales bacterium]|jgi:hypothetical protein|nr:hypothetical protein [Puniceicoccales bacterium]
MNQTSEGISEEILSGSPTPIKIFMATWITIQTSDLYDYLCATQLNALKSTALAPGQTNPVDEIIDAVTARIRAEISGSGKNLLSANGAQIPKDLKSYACYLILESVQTRLPSLKLTADQIRLANDAKEYLKRIAKGEVPVSAPDNATIGGDFTVSASCDVVHSRAYCVSEKSLRGF